MTAPTDTGEDEEAEVLTALGPRALEPPTFRRERGPVTTSTPVLESSATAVGVIWLAAAAVSVAAPDMVTGSEHEHLPLALMTVWLWAAVGTAYAVMTPRRAGRASWTVAVSVVWLVAALTAVAAPVMVTGTDPTRIPLAAVIAPPVAAVVTGLLSLHHAAHQD